jgi:hypothetical protein
MDTRRQREHVREPDRIRCLECGKCFRALPRHLARAHEMEVDDYRAKYGIRVGEPLVCGEWSAAIRASNKAKQLGKHLTGRGPRPGFTQRDFVRRQRAQQYKQLAAIGTDAISAMDRTEDRRRRLAPYPVTISQAAERLQCSLSAAYTFLSYCVSKGRLRRIRRGVYDKV